MEELVSAAQCSLEIANKQGIRSIALPAISGGIYGFPIHLVARCIFKAIDKFVNSAADAQYLTLKNIMVVNDQSVNHSTFIKELRDFNFKGNRKPVRPPTSELMQA